MSVFQFRQFSVSQERSAMKIGTDSVLLGCLVQHQQPSAILDIGTGTGLLALMMAQRFPSASVDAVEIDAAAYEEAAHNFAQSPWNDRIDPYLSSFQQYVKGCNKKYDLIISNPPYYKGTDNIRIEDVQRSRARHDNELPFEELLNGCAGLLNNTGNCWFILPEQEGEMLISLSAECGLFLYHKVAIQPKQSKGVNRLVLGFANTKRNFSEQHITIYNEDGSYTRAYYQLTQAFYLWNNIPEGRG